MIDLSLYSAVDTALCARIDVPGYAVLRFNDSSRSVVISGETYPGLGNLLSITDSSMNLRVSPGNLSITISGIPSTSIAEIVNNRIRGSAVTIWRVFRNATTGEVLNINGNPMGRFTGIVSNYSLEETWDNDSLSATNTILLDCASTIEVLNNKVSGRRTNSQDQKSWYPSDVSMDRVANLANSNFNFGAVIK